MIDRINSNGNDDYLQRLRSSDRKKAEAYKKTEKRSVLSDSLSSEGSNITDQFNLSAEAKEAKEIQSFVSELKKAPEIREDVVASAKQELEDGTLDSEQNIEATISSLINGIL